MVIKRKYSTLYVHKPLPSQKKNLVQHLVRVTQAQKATVAVPLLSTNSSQLMVAPAVISADRGLMFPTKLPLNGRLQKLKVSALFFESFLRATNFGSTVLSVAATLCHRRLLLRTSLKYLKQPLKSLKRRLYTSRASSKRLLLAVY